MHLVSELSALRCLAAVRWSLLESYALARQEGLTEPVGLVVDRSYPYGAELSRHLLVGQEPSGSSGPSVTCMERATLGSLLASAAPDLCKSLRQHSDEPGKFCAVLVAESGWVLTGTWQDLFTLEAAQSPKASRRRS